MKQQAAIGIELSTESLAGVYGGRRPSDPLVLVGWGFAKAQLAMGRAAVKVGTAVANAATSVWSAITSIF
jgi:hypothetical protein